MWIIYPGGNISQDNLFQMGANIWLLLKTSPICQICQMHIIQYVHKIHILKVDILIVEMWIFFSTHTCLFWLIKNHVKHSKFTRKPSKTIKNAKNSPKQAIFGFKFNLDLKRKQKWPQTTSKMIFREAIILGVIKIFM